MTRQDLGVLRLARDAVSEGLINDGDYDLVKLGYIRASQIRQGLDAGLWRDADPDRAREVFLGSLDIAPPPLAGGGWAAPPTPSSAPAPRERPAAASVSGAGNGAAPPLAPRPSALGAGDGGSPAVNGGGGAAAAAAAAASPSPAKARPMFGSVKSTLSPGRDAPPGPQAHALSDGGARGAAGSSGGGAPLQPARSGGGGGGGAPPTRSSSGGAPPARSSSGGGGAFGRAASLSAPAASMLPPDVPQYVQRGVAAGKCSMAGIGLHEDCINLYLHLKQRSAFKWITFKVDSSGKTVVPDSYGSKDSSYADFVGHLPPEECRYGVYDYEYVSPERGSFGKIVFVNWAPETAAIKAKMMYASTKDFFKGFLEGTGAELQATDSSDLTEEEIRNRVVANITRK
ncbi:MAG: hypothetical protein J3K34DRAFT_521469 [Monoraphidium minutum]|nr:MAG: hypothetical protein J3K34DRAFT_521469 [Monoraphidium minutum]